MRVVVIKGWIPTNIKQGPLSDIKVLSLTASHHEHRVTERIVKGVESYFFPLPRNQSTLERSLIMEKDMHCLSIICGNHIFQDSIDFL